jgi:hypothetical protein
MQALIWGLVAAAALPLGAAAGGWFRISGLMEQAYEAGAFLPVAAGFAAGALIDNIPEGAVIGISIAAWSLIGVPCAFASVVGYFAFSTLPGPGSSPHC